MSLSRVLLGMAGVTAGFAVLVNMPVTWFMTVEKATLRHLEGAKLQTIDSAKRNFSEALELSSLKSELDAHRVGLHAVVHETLGVKEFQEYFKGDIYLDLEKTFYGPKERWFPVIGLLRVNVIRNLYRAYAKAIPGNMKGEGRLLGAVYVIGKGDQGIVYQHLEKEFGDIVKLDDVKKALQQIKNHSKL